jgi:archaemetzincin
VKRALGLSLGLLALFFLGGGQDGAAPKVAVAIQPLGAVDRAILDVIRTGIASAFQVDVRLLAERELPPEAYYKPRARYRAEKLLDFLLGLPAGSADKVVGITQKDISTTKDEHEDWGIFGLGLVGGRVCVVSTFRLRKGPAREELFRARLMKVVNHELGHTFGLDHCPAPGCLMEDAGGSIRTVDRETGELCPACRARLGALVKAGP